ncbi:MAG: hypothetical protein N5P05_004279 (plasmid) [Chroococcopsis gigantea SAG 12.99]|jgi:hypothetical protein|nr:hypothetical protein [Chroococcopsis gigantea SAG 12.99]
MKIITLPAGGKFYVTPCGLFPSVTTVLAATKPLSQKQGLKKWYERNGSEADNLRQAAADRGKVIHRPRFKGEDIECPPDVNAFWEEAQKVLGAIDSVVASEQTLYHPQYHYAGTLDLLAYWRDSFTLFDFKTSHRPKRIQWLTDAKLQIAAYRAAYQYLYGVEIAQGLIAVITPDTVQLFTLEEEELESSWREWSLRLEEYQNFSLYDQLFANKY